MQPRLLVHLLSLQLLHMHQLLQKLVPFRRHFQQLALQIADHFHLRTILSYKEVKFLFDLCEL